MRHPSENELKATARLALPIEEASAKVRTGPPARRRGGLRAAQLGRRDPAHHCGAGARPGRPAAGARASRCPLIRRRLPAARRRRDRAGRRRRPSRARPAAAPRAARAHPRRSRAAAGPRVVEHVRPAPIARHVVSGRAPLQRRRAIASVGSSSTGADVRHAARARRARARRPAARVEQAVGRGDLLGIGHAVARAARRTAGAPRARARSSSPPSSCRRAASVP